MNLATGTRITLNQTFEILRELTGYSGRADLCGSARRRYSRLAGRHRAGEELLGYEPQVDFREGLRRTVEWYRTGAAVEPDRLRQSRLSFLHLELLPDVTRSY